jgi:hypothetical protein
VKPVVTAFSGRDSSLEAKPTWSKDPAVGMRYMEIVSLKATVLEFAVMVHGSVVEVASIVKVILVERFANVGAVRPMYASPDLSISSKHPSKLRRVPHRRHRKRDTHPSLDHMRKWSDCQWTTAARA